MDAIDGSHKKIKRLTICLILAAVVAAGVPFPATLNAEPGRIRTIVVDPGHGGHDTGARGSTGGLEKEIALHLAQVLAEAMTPAYNAVLTRTGDYQMALTRRASVANNHEADLFISLHAGERVHGDMNAWSVFYFSAPSRNPARNRERELPGKALKDRELDAVLQWDRMGLRHHRQSRIFAECVKAQLAGNPDIAEITVSTAALRVLEGLDMPAIVIETGNLGHPETEKQLNDPAFLTDIVGRIKQGVDVYLTR